MQQPTRPNEYDHGSEDLLDASAPKQEHEKKPKKADRDSNNPAKKFYGWLRAHYIQVIGLSTHEKLNLLFTLVIAVATVSYVIVTKRQLDEMRASGVESDRQIKQLIEQAGRQATNTQDLAAAAKDQAKAYNDIAEQTKLNGARSDKALNSTIAEFQLEQRAWLSVTVTGEEPTVGKKDTITVHMHNSGKTYGVNMRLSANIAATYDVTRKRPPVSPKFGNIVDFGPNMIIAPGDTGEHDSFIHDPNGGGLTDMEVDWLKTGRSVVWMFGKVIYDDVFGKHHWVKFCFYRVLPDTSFVTCGDKGTNDIDK